MTETKTALMWFRRDLRLTDNTALARALKENERVVGVFVLDDALLRARDIGAARAAFLFRSLETLTAEFRQHGGQMVLRRGGVPEDELLALAREAGASALYFNTDYTPYSRERDERVRAASDAAGIDVRAFDDALLVPPQNIVDPRDGEPFETFTPFKRVWETRERVGARQSLRFSALKVETALPSSPQPTLGEYGLTLTQTIPEAGEGAALASLAQFVRAGLASYADNRDNTGDGNSTSALSVHLKYGTLSARDCWRGRRAARGRGSGRTSWHGGTSSTRCCGITPPCCKRPFSPRWRRCALTRMPSSWNAGRRARRAIPMWTRASGRCWRRVGCTTELGRWRRRS